MTKRKLPRRFEGCTFSSVHLYRDDLERILEYLNEAKPKSITISDGEYAYDTLDEFREAHGSKIRKIEISSSSPSLTIRLEVGIFKVWLFCHDETPDAITARVSIHDLLRDRTSIIAKIIPPKIVYFLSIILFGTVGSWVAVLQKWGGKEASFSAFIGYFVLFTLLIANSLGVFTSVRLDRHHEVQTFFGRKRDDIIILLLGTALGIGGTLLAQWLSR